MIMKNKKVLIRCDFNVPQDEKGTITQYKIENKDYKEYGNTFLCNGNKINEYKTIKQNEPKNNNQIYFNNKKNKYKTNINKIK